MDLKLKDVEFVLKKFENEITDKYIGYYMVNVGEYPTVDIKISKEGEFTYVFQYNISEKPLYGHISNNGIEKCEKYKLYSIYVHEKDSDSKIIYLKKEIENKIEEIKKMLKKEKI